MNQEGLNIADKRKELGLSQADLAKLAEISRVTLSRVEQGRNHTVGTLNKIHCALLRQQTARA